MNCTLKKQTPRALSSLSLVFGGMLVLSLAACEQELAAKQNGKDFSQTLEQVGKQVENKVAQTQTAVSEKTVDAGVVVSDAAVTTQVKAALLAEPGLASLQLHVETAEGVVTLTGTTDNAANREQAEHVASTIHGVIAVRNNLVVRSQS